MTKQPMIINCFPFFDELDLLELRLHELADIVDVFVLTESPYTFTGQDKPMHFADNRARFNEFNIVDAVYLPASVCSPSEYERRQKQHNLNEAFKILRPGDVLIISDVDEIPKAEVISNALDDEWHTAGLVLKLFYYFLNCMSVSEKTRWDCRMVRYSEPFKYNIKQNDRVDKYYYDAGWHFSFIGDIQAKIAAWGHARQYDRPPYNTPEHIEKCKADGIDIFMRKGRRAKKFEFINELDYLPGYVKDNIGKFERYLR